MVSHSQPLSKWLWQNAIKRLSYSKNSTFLATSENLLKLATRQFWTKISFFFKPSFNFTFLYNEKFCCISLVLFPWFSNVSTWNVMYQLETQVSMEEYQQKIFYIYCSKIKWIHFRNSGNIFYESGGKENNLTCKWRKVVASTWSNSPFRGWWKVCVSGTLLLAVSQ